VVFTVRVGEGSASERGENVEFVAFWVGEARPRHVVALAVAAALIERWAASFTSATPARR